MRNANRIALAPRGIAPRGMDEPTKTPAMVVVGYLSGDHVCADFAACLFKLGVMSLLYLNDYRIASIINTKTSIVHKGRNDLVLQAMKIPNATHLLFLDSDMTFPHDTIKRLLDRNERIIGCDYSTRRAPYKPTRRGELLGFGCILIDLSVFREMPFPWFEIPYVNGECMGEDFTFCKKAGEAGLKVACHEELSKELGHLGMTEHKL